MTPKPLDINALTVSGVSFCGTPELFSVLNIRSICATGNVMTAICCLQAAVCGELTPLRCVRPSYRLLRQAYRRPVQFRADLELLERRALEVAVLHAPVGECPDLLENVRGRAPAGAAFLMENLIVILLSVFQVLNFPHISHCAHYGFPYKTIVA